MIDIVAVNPVFNCLHAPNARANNNGRAWT